MDQAAAQVHLDRWLAAEAAVATGQSYAIGDRSLTRADAAHIAERVSYWTRVVERFEAVANGATQPAASQARWY